jgi:hypothetical protein
VAGLVEGTLSGGRWKQGGLVAREVPGDVSAVSIDIILCKIYYYDISKKLKIDS